MFALLLSNVLMSHIKWKGRYWSCILCAGNLAYWYKFILCRDKYRYKDVYVKFLTEIENNTKDDHQQYIKKNSEAFKSELTQDNFQSIIIYCIIRCFTTYSWGNRIIETLKKDRLCKFKKRQDAPNSLCRKYPMVKGKGKVIML